MDLPKIKHSGPGGQKDYLSDGREKTTFVITPHLL
jgi:hypothetical protein